MVAQQPAAGGGWSGSGGMTCTTNCDRAEANAMTFALIISEFSAADLIHSARSHPSILGSGGFGEHQCVNICIDDLGVCSGEFFPQLLAGLYVDT